MKTKSIRALVTASLLLPLLARAADAPKRTPELLEKGKTSFAKNCASCTAPRARQTARRRRP